MLLATKSFLVLGLHVAISLSFAKELRHESQFASTENEFEFDYSTKIVRAKESESTSTGSTLFVGGFKLATEDDFVRDACDHIEDQFQTRTDCTCNLSLLQNSTVQYGCRNKHRTCNQQEFCARSVYTGTVSLESPVFLSDFCLKDLQKHANVYGNLCVAVDYDSKALGEDNISKIKGCRAQIGKRKCTCTICGGGSGIRLDCSDIEDSLISTRCDDVSVVTKIMQQDQKVGGYFPSFE
jgi:hypothetical protein